MCVQTRVYCNACTQSFIYLYQQLNVCLPIAPSNIEKVDAYFINTSHIFANWTEPEFLNGNLRYEVNMTSTDLLTNTTFLFISTVVVDTSILIEVSMAVFEEYEVTVVPFTGAGRGATAMSSFQTPEGGIHI